MNWMGTFHSITVRLLREHARVISLDCDFAIMDRNDNADMIDVIRYDLSFTHTKKRFSSKKTYLDIYSRCVNAEKSIVEVLDVHFPHCRGWDSELAALFSMYVKAKIPLSKFRCGM